MLTLARETGQAALEGKKLPAYEKEADALKLMGKCGGVFVTYHNKGELRGCIGCFNPSEPLATVVQSRAGWYSCRQSLAAAHARLCIMGARMRFLVSATIPCPWIVPWKTWTKSCVPVFLSTDPLCMRPLLFCSCGLLRSFSVLALYLSVVHVPHLRFLLSFSLSSPLVFSQCLDLTLSLTVASTQDYRFSYNPITPKEFREQVDVEISILSNPKAIKDPLKEVVVGKHGIIVSKGHYRGTYLPQVATEQGWDVKTFVTHW